MVNKALNIVADKLAEVLSKSGFTREKINDVTIAFKGKNSVYLVFFNNNKISLASKNIDDDSDNVSEDFDDAKVISEWFFDPENSTEKDASSIASDFLEVFTGACASKVSERLTRISRERTDSNGLQFFLNRLVTLFPELKSKVFLEKNTYGRCRYVTFIKESFVPLFLNLADSCSKKDDKLRKTINVLNNFYENGNMDVRSTITIVILNSLESPSTIEKVESFFTNSLKVAFRAAYKYKNKSVKPEKVKKTLLGKLLAASSSTGR